MPIETPPRWEPTRLWGVRCWGLVVVFAACVLTGSVAESRGDGFDVVLLGGRVLDPESGLDAVRNVGIQGGTVTAVTERAIEGATTLDVSGLVVAPGFIDLHEHGHDLESYRLQVQDGVTSSLELELGSADVGAWYAAREGTTPLHYGVSAGHARVRMQVMRDPGSFIPIGDGAHRAASEAELAAIRRGLRAGLQQGAAALGLLIQLTPAATVWEVLEAFRVAAEFDAPCVVHLRYQGGSGATDSVAALAEVIAASASTGVPAHVVHLTSNGLGATPQLLAMIDAARARGIDVTTELYPYNAATNPIDSAMLDPGWQTRLGIGYGDLQWVETGERLTEASFRHYRAAGGGLVLFHMIREPVVRVALVHPETLIASDGIRGHPRRAGTFSRVLGRYVREEGLLSLMDAVRKMTWLPAQRLEGRVPSMQRKGRVRVGADADLTVFDAERVVDVATYEAPDRPSEGIVHVLVGGVPVVLDGSLREGVAPGRPIRARIQ